MFTVYLYICLYTHLTPSGAEVSGRPVRQVPEEAGGGGRPGSGEDGGAGTHSIESPPTGDGPDRELFCH